MKNYIIGSLAFGAVFTVLSCLAGMNISASAAMGAASGLLFALLLSIVTHILQSELIKNAPEGCLHAEAANYLTRAEAVGGRIFLCNDRLEFRAHVFNFHRIALSIPYDEIKKVGYTRFPERVRLSLMSGTDAVFIVSSGRKFAEALARCGGPSESYGPDPA